jgi:hypothetical protein
MPHYIKMNIKYTISIENNTNKAVSSSEDKFTGVNNGSLIKIDGDPILHMVQKRDSFFYLKDFKTDGGKIVSVDGDVGVFLQKGDSVRLVYKEYEAKLVINIIEKGRGYLINDKPFSKGGILAMDIASGMVQRTCFKIKKLTPEGGIDEIEILEPGKYILPPDEKCELNSVYGSGAILQVKYLEISAHSSLSRTIDNLYFSDDKTFIVFDYSLPPNLNSGQISVEKNALYLTENYLGETKRNLKYEIFRDFTPNFKIPLMLKNSLSPEIVYNKSCSIIDRELQLIKNDINLIKEQLNIK